MKLTKYNKIKNTNIHWLGDIPEHWEVKRIKDVVAKTGSGTTPLGGSTVYKDSGITFIRSQNVYNDGLRLDNVSFISEEVHKKMKGSELRPLDILINITGASIGRTCLLPASFSKGNINQHIIFLRIHGKKVFFISEYMKSIFVKDYILSVQIGTSKEALTQGQLLNMPISLPPLSEQTAIANYLDQKTAQIDKKVDLLSQKIEKYKELKKSLINETICRGLDKNIKLKPSGIDWIGDIPEHWEVKRVKDSSYVKGRIGWQGLRSDEFIDNSDWYCITGTDFQNGKIDWKNCYCVEKDRYEQDSKIQLKIDDLLITKDGSIGKIALIDVLPKKTTLNSGVFLMRPLKNMYLNKYMYWLLESYVFKGFINYNKNGSTILHLYQNVFERFTFFNPPISEQAAITQYLDEKTSKIDQITANLSQQMAALKELRKTLINEVVTGKVRVN